MPLIHAYDIPRSPERVVVLGATGFLGRRLLRACAAAGVPAVGLGSRELDLSAPDAGAQLAERLRPRDVLVFLSALTREKGRDSGTVMRNLAMARAVCRASEKAELAQIVYASSEAVYSFDTALISEETPAILMDLYGAMHRMRELILLEEAKAPLAILRLAALYGAGDTHNSYGPNRFVRQALAEKRIALFGNGEEMRDHVYIDDAAALTLRVVAHGSSGILNLACGTSEDFLTAAKLIAKLIAARLGGAIAIEPSQRANPITHRHFDSTNLHRAFPDMQFTAFAEGLAKTTVEMLAETKADG
jgi:nucleoside-diphosphate-sugar epimerase